MTVVRFARAVRFDKPRSVADYIEDGKPLPGLELGGLILPPMALDAYAASRTSREPCEIVVTGEEWTADGSHFLTFGVSREYIEATTDYRHVQDKGLTYVCPECMEYSGRHRKSCRRGTSPDAVA